ncbi:sarcosine oxidase subunit alpha [Nisaea sediminum]|uniref:sarcosine oxidase subunit alpha n=1 Tax=Nisaea sediminum TaxID=2775867 RepID=UPI001865BDBD|nr:sarcosine oxidase subunit alpha [Nisaea sediminum]
MSGQSFRIRDRGRIDRQKPVRFRFDGKTYGGYEGDTLASALLANGVHLVGRSFKYHRPRGILGAGSEEPNALIQLGAGNRTEPNLRATQIEIFDGLQAESQNRWPCLKYDIGAINSVFHRLLPSGFYYKTFMWPASLWMTYEHVIRNAAGLGKAPQDRDPDRYEKMHAHADVLVVGGGPAGLAAALAAGKTGARVILMEETADWGGALLSESDSTVDGKDPARWAAETVAELEAMPDVTLVKRCTVTGYYDHNYLTALERVSDHLGAAPEHTPRQRLWKIRAKRVVLATGALERPLVFSDNDRPGVMLSSAVRAYINRYGVLPGRKVVIFTNNDDAYRTALAIEEAHGKVAAIVDARTSVSGALADAARAKGITIYENHGIVSVQGKTRVSGVEVMQLDATGAGVTGSAKSVNCDLVAMSGGWNPTVHLFSQAKGKLAWNDEMAAFVPGTASQALASAGACNGSFALDDVLKEGLKLGAEAAREAGFKGRAPAAPKSSEPEQGALRPLWIAPGKAKLGRKGKHFVDFQNDVTAADVQLAAREGYRSVEHLKRYTTTGMGTDQGKTSNVNALAILSDTLASEIPATGTTTFRPPYTPATIGAYTGRNVGKLFEPIRKTRIDEWARAHGAKFEHVGQWMRAWYFPKPGETFRQSIDREVKAVRDSVGILDASTLGKIDIQGPDAAEFLNRIYTNAWLKLGVGRCRYGLMLKEDGMVMDDGVTTRIGENHFHMTTTTGGAANVLSWLEEWHQTEWPELKVFFTSVTEQWSVVAVNGRKSRALLEKLCSDTDFSAAAFPFMSMKEGTVAGIPAKIYRISFTGELSFEVNVPARYGLALWEALMEAGKEFDITPYGTETMHVLRAEKGFIIVGQETDGTVTPLDLGMDWIVSKQKPDFIGKRSLERASMAAEDRKQLVGLLTEDPNIVLPEGGHVVEHLKPQPPMDMLGHVTSSYYSPNCGRSIAMALIKGGHKRHGQTLHVPLEDKLVKVTVTEPRFFDLEGKRIDG